MKKLIIVGGGAAGFFLASNLDGLEDVKTTIIEQSKEVLQKVKISGGGRCNVSHACFDPQELVRYYPRGQKELLSVFNQFQPADTMAWFETNHVPLKIEDDNRIFPQSNTSQSVIDIFLKKSEENKISILTQTTVLEIEFEDNQWHLTTTKGKMQADYLVIASGSSIKIWRMLSDLGHNIVHPTPSLFSFKSTDIIFKDMQGTTFEHASITIPTITIEEQGALLITHWGISGPCVLKASAWGAKQLAHLGYHFEVEINFIGQDKEQALTTLNHYKTKQSKSLIYNIKPFELTKKFWHRVLEVASINPSKNWADLNKEEINRIADVLTTYKVEITGKNTYKDEFVTAGGIELKEVNFKTMESKIYPHLFFAGEVLDIDAVTGGFNFQACWSEAYIISQTLKAISN